MGSVAVIPQTATEPRPFVPNPASRPEATVPSAPYSLRAFGRTIFLWMDHSESLSGSSG